MMDENGNQGRVDPGVNPQLVMTHFTPEEQKIIKRVGRDWYVTNGGKEIQLGPTSRYRYVLVKPTDLFKEMFNLDREIILIFSPYEVFEPRSLTALSAAADLHQTLRIERICSMLVSKDEGIVIKLRELLKNDQEAQIVVPFTYQELCETKKGPYFFRNRFIEHFYARDLFASESPLRKDLYFFGRTDLVHSLVNRHRSNQVSGLFGLRKTGKTSVIFGVQRGLLKISGVSAFVDCQTPAFHQLRWHFALHFVLDAINKQNNSKVRIGDMSSYTAKDAPSLFEKYLTKISHKLGSKKIMIIFDEVENITPTVSPTKHWKDGQDFVLFWQTIRSLFQSSTNLFSYLLVGTNPLCVELPTIGRVDNPLFAQVPIEYIPGFDVPQTREMVRKLGRIMGLKFDEIIYSRLTDDCGGHPYLMRHICSIIHKTAPVERPVRVDKTRYSKAVETFIRDYSQFLEMILSVLREYFNDEYEMLRMISRGDLKTFQEFAELSPLYTNHLLGYGVLQEVEQRFDFRIEVIKKYLRSKEKYKRLNLTIEQKRTEISERRNDLEEKLRKLCNMQLLAQVGETTAKAGVLSLLGNPRKTKNASYSLREIMSGNKSGLLFSDLSKILSKNWECFKNIFGPNKDQFLSDMQTINTFRIDAHAKDIMDEEFAVFRLSARRVESQIKSFLG